MEVHLFAAVIWNVDLCILCTVCSGMGTIRIWIRKTSNIPDPSDDPYSDSPIMMTNKCCLFMIFFIYLKTLLESKNLWITFFRSDSCFGILSFFCLFSLLDPDPHCRYKEKKTVPWIEDERKWKIAVINRVEPEQLQWITLEDRYRDVKSWT